MDEDSVFVTEYQKTSFHTFDFNSNTICSVQHVEFTDIYPITDSITDLQSEEFAVIDKLKALGFAQEKFIGWGNWQEGPRTINFIYTNGTCACEVDKLYYSTEKPNQFRVTEALNCHVSD